MGALSIGGLIFSVFKAFLGGGGIAQVGKQLVDAHRDTLAAGNTTEKTMADLSGRALELDAREAEINAKVVVAEQGNWVTRWVRPAWSAPYIIYTWKVLVYDLCLGLGTTPELKGYMANLGVTIAVSYFGARGVEKIADKLMGTRRAVTGR